MTSPFEYAPAPESRSIVDIKPSYGLFIDGEFVDGHGKSFKTISPATEEVLAEVAEADEADVDAAVKAARKAYDKVWGRMPGRDAVLLYVSDQQLVRPQFVGIPQFLRFLASTVLYPDNRIVRQLPRLAAPGQFSQCYVQAELKKLLNTQHHAAAADVVVLRNGFITLAR